MLLKNSAVPVLLLCCLSSAVHRVTSTIHAEGRCIWYGQCYQSSPGKWYNCYNNTEKVLLEDDSPTYKALKNTCPWYISDKPNSTYACCDYDQINTLGQSTTSLALQQLGRCPSCIQNFMKVFCAITCDPSSAMFMNPSKISNVTVNNETKQIVDIMDVYFTNFYADKFFNSCKNVQNSQESSKAIDLMCGSNHPCTGQKWLEFMGTPQPASSAPFLLNFTFTSDPSNKGLPPNMRAYNASLLKCSDKIGGVACSCSDCPVMCPAKPAVPPDKGSLKISFIPIGIFVGVVGFIVYTIVFVVVVMVMVSLTSIGEYKKLTSSTAPHDSFFLTRAGQIFEGWISRLFARWGLIAANYWYLVIPISLLVVGACCGGLKFFEVTTDPVELWSAPNSRSRLEKNYYDEHFGPFYRTAQIIITAPGSPGFTVSDVQNYKTRYHFSGMFQQYILNEILTMQTEIANITATYKGSHGKDTVVTLSDICLQPLAPDNTNCTIYSVLNYFQNDRALLNKEVEQIFTVIANSSYHIQYCTRDPTSLNDTNLGVPCMAAYGGPVDPNVALGDFETVNGTGQYTLAKAIIVTFVINNHVNHDENKPAVAWEKEFIKYLKAYKQQHPNSNLSFSFSSESSLSEELNRESLADAHTIAISYLLMFLYIALFLGSFARKLILAFYGLFGADSKTKLNAGIIVNSRIGMGLVGVILVGLSVVAALGLLSYIRLKGTMIIIEVVPFLVLAVGTDNLFILTHAYERRRNCSNAGTPVSKLISDALGEVAPSILLTSLTETMAFLLGGISTEPAVRTFSFFAGAAVFINFLLQITVFTSVLSLDSRRIANDRLDLFCCIRTKKDEEEKETQESLLYLFMKNCYAPFLLHKIVRATVVYFFGALFFGMLIGLFNQSIGISQTIAYPKDSYLLDYLNDIKYLRTGSPLYFVIKDGYDYTNKTNQNNICTSAGCSNNSLGTQISSAALIPEYSRIAEHASSWLDTYIAWIDPRSGCCVVHDRTASNVTMCKNHSDPSCEPCLEITGESYYRPSPAEFVRYLPWFLNTNPDTSVCSQGGHAAFHSAVDLKENKTIKASYLMTYHTVLQDSVDYIDALRRAREYADKFSDTINHEVFAYSVFYVYYEQYLTIKTDVPLNLCVSLAGVFVMSFLLMGFNLISALLVTGTVALIIVNMLGMMAFVGISLNAVSLVNLVMAIGISVEFCSHIVRWFAHSQENSRVERAKDAVAHMGTSVLSGITFTKLLGVLVLAFAQSQIFVKYYFGMYMLMIGFGALHGLVFLPVLLSYIGPFPLPSTDENLFYFTVPPEDPVNYESRSKNGSLAIRQSPYHSLDLGGPNENSKLLDSNNS